MFRRQVLQGSCLACFGFGMLLGYNLESWLICCVGGVAVILLGLCRMKRR